MSVLGTQVFANSSTPCWIAANGGVANELSVNILDVTNGIQLRPGDNPAVVNGRITAGLDVAQTMYLQTVDKITFGEIGTGNVNSYIQVSPFGSGGDQLVIGGTISADAIGPPTQILTVPQTTALLAAPTTWLNDTNVPTVIGQEFDVNIKLEFGLTAGAYTAGDTVTVEITCDGTPTYQNKGSWEYVFLAGGPTGAAANFKAQIRDRFICTNPAAAIECSVFKTVANPATAISCTCEQFDVVRVA